MQVFTVGGSFSGQLNVDKGGEILAPPYFPGNAASWRETTGIDAVSILSDDPQGAFRTDNYGFLFAWTGNSGARPLCAAPEQIRSAACVWPVMLQSNLLNVVDPRIMIYPTFCVQQLA